MKTSNDVFGMEILDWYVDEAFCFISQDEEEWYGCGEWL